MDIEAGFRETFLALTGNKPFPWQKALFAKFVAGDFESCRTCTLATGLGKTCIIAIWLIALARRPDLVPRRLVYVVNRRTVVDQTSDEVRKYRDLLAKAASRELVELASKLRNLCAIDPAFLDSPLAISTLRGQFADNREWSTDPARPAVICGTVDMIGSRLLFRGYGIGYRSSPLHAGFLARDVLLIHDEAHLEPAFQKLILDIEKEQAAGRFPEPDECRRLKVIELTATTRTDWEAFQLTSEDLAHPVVKDRYCARKVIHLHAVESDAKCPEKLAELALAHRESGSAILVFARTVDAVDKIAAKLKQANQPFECLTGTMRGLERDKLVMRPVFLRFLSPRNRPEDIEPECGTVFLVCTSAGEVGVNISADHLVCDLTTFESMAQRFGRVNRFGEHDDTRIDVVYPESFGKGDKISPYDAARMRTLDLLRRLSGDASPRALANVDAGDRAAAFAPQPVTLPTTDILFDAWSLTTITSSLPGRPPVEPFLHGLPAEHAFPDTYFAWRQEVQELGDEVLDDHPPEELLDAYPLLPHELLREPCDRAFKAVQALAGRHPHEPVWVINDAGKVQRLTLEQFSTQYDRESLAWQTVVLPPNVGGLRFPQGTLDGNAVPPAEDSGDRLDVADDRSGDGERRRIRFWGDDPEIAEKSQAARQVGMRLVREIVIPADDDSDDAEQRVWYWYVARGEGGRTSRSDVKWKCHVADVVRHTQALVEKLQLPREIGEAVELAARWHDHGKRRAAFQLLLGNSDFPDESKMLAKSGGRGLRIPETYRHEFGSLLDVLSPQSPEFAEWQQLSPTMQDLVLHLIAAHHGRARPHFPPNEVQDPAPPGDVSAEVVAAEVPRRFTRLQRQFGRWGLAYLESLLRAADWAASANPTCTEVSPT